MTLHGAPLPMEFFFCVALLPHLWHSVFVSWLTLSLQKFALVLVRLSPVASYWGSIRPRKFVVLNSMYGLVTLGEFGVVFLRENVPGIFMLLRAGGYHCVHGPGSKCSLYYDDGAQLSRR